MTTPQAAAAYLAEHKQSIAGAAPVIHNPHGKPLEELPHIYGFVNGGEPGWWECVLVAENGTLLGGQVCSHPDYAPHDLGILTGCREDRHEQFRALYPDGYRMEFISYAAARDHQGLRAAMHLAALRDAEPANTQAI